MGSKRTIIVNGQYIASQTIGTQILHADRVYTNNPDKERPHEVEDVSFEQVNTHFCYITEKCVKNAMVEHLETHLRIACKGTAEALWKTIHEFEFMGYLTTQDVDATKIYNALTAHFGALPFGVVNFRKYRTCSFA